MKIPKKIIIPPINKDLAYFCGLLAGDGYIAVRENKCEYSVYCSGNPKDEMEFYDETVVPLVEKLFGIKTKGIHFGKTYGVRIYSKNLVEFLLKGLKLTPSPKNDLQIPQIFNTKELMPSLIKGFSDTDFGINIKKKKLSCSEGF